MFTRGGLLIINISSRIIYNYIDSVNRDRQRQWWDTIVILDISAWCLKYGVTRLVDQLRSRSTHHSQDHLLKNMPGGKCRHSPIWFCTMRITKTTGMDSRKCWGGNANQHTRHHCMGERMDETKLPSSFYTWRNTWSHIYTDGSAEQAARNGEVVHTLIKPPSFRNLKCSWVTQRIGHTTNKDCLFLQALSSRTSEQSLASLKKTLQQQLSIKTNVLLQWITSHYRS